MATFELLGQKFLALDAHKHQDFTEALSFFIDCEAQDEVDYYWSALTAGGGREQMCGCVKDKFGVSWQVIPQSLGRYLMDRDRAKADMSNKKSTVSLPNDTDVVVVRDFDAPRTLVFDAWTKPALMQRWLLGPPG
jgi:predicted 3-demethylubiquinone-9 3-methyltransferase (glyoxalase superfamily)